MSADKQHITEFETAAGLTPGIRAALRHLHGLPAPRMDGRITSADLDERLQVTKSDFDTMVRSLGAHVPGTAPRVAPAPAAAEEEGE